MFDHVRQFTDITRPLMSLQFGDRCFREQLIIRPIASGGDEAGGWPRVSGPTDVREERALESQTH